MPAYPQYLAINSYKDFSKVGPTWVCPISFEMWRFSSLYNNVFVPFMTQQLVVVITKADNTHEHIASGWLSG